MSFRPSLLKLDQHFEKRVMGTTAPKEIQWHEPAAYRRAMARQLQRKNPWEALKVTGFVFAGMMGLYAYVRFVPPPNPNRPGWLVATGIAVLTGVFAGYMFPWLLLLFPNSIVILSSKGINNNIVGHGVKIRFWAWDRVAACQIRIDTHEGQPFRTITLLNDADQELATFGLREKPTVDEIRDVLATYGKSLIWQGESP